MDNARRARRDAESASRTPESLARFRTEARRELGAAGGPLLAERTEQLRSRWVSARMVEAGRARAASLGWPDAYAYTKALGERALLANRGDVPVSIVRPSIIESALAEPAPGWIRGFRMAEPVIISYARGLLDEFPGVPEGVIDVIPVDLVTVVWKRVARQDPALLIAYTRSAIPLVARSAGLAVATCGHPDAAATVSRDFEQAAAGARIAYLQATCLVDARRCLELLDAARKAPETAVRAAALTLGPPEGRRVPAESLAVCLHDKDPNVVRAALEALTDGPVAGIEKDLEILAQGGPDDIREQALRTLARAGTRPAAAALARIVKQFPDSTAIGHLARELYKEGLGEVVLMGNAAGAIPVSATLTSEPDGRLAFRLYNDEGFRVVVRGALYLKCQGLPQTRTDVNVQDFEADGTLRLEVRCRRGGPPEVQWKRRDGHRFRASITDF